MSSNKLTYSRTCHHCQAPFATLQPNARHCSRKCKTDAANLEAARGKQLYRLAYGWRTGSGAKFSDLSWLTDSFIREDRELGRPPPPLDRGDHHTVATARFGALDRKRREA